MTDSLHFIFVELDRFDKKWEDIDNDKERFYSCIRHMHELENLPEGLAEGCPSRKSRNSRDIPTLTWRELPGFLSDAQAIRHQCVNYFRGIVLRYP